MTTELRTFSDLGPKHKTSIYRDFGWANFTIASGQTTSNSIDLGPAATIAIFCPASENGKTCSIQTTYDGTNYVQLTSITLATGMNFFLGDEAVKVMHCQITRLVLGSATGSNVTIRVSVKG